MHDDRHLQTSAEDLSPDNDLTEALATYETEPLNDDLLDTQHAAVSAVVLHRSLVRIDDLVAAAWAQLRSEAVRRHLTVCIHARRDVHREAWMLYCDKHQVLQVLLALIERAIKMTAEGGLIFVKTWSNADDVCVSVRARGQGMSGLELDQGIQQSCNVHGVVNAAPGLRGVQAVIVAHGGRLLSQAAGTSVTLTLPRWLGQ